MKSVLIIGLGRFGRHMAQKFLEADNDVMAIEMNEARADDAVGDIQHILIGDAREERFMKGIGVEDFDLAVIAIGEDFTSVLEITVLLKELGCRFVIARATSEVHKKLLLHNGADVVSYADWEAAEEIAITYGGDSILNFVKLTPEYGISTVKVPKKWVGKNMIQLDIRNKYRLNVLAIVEHDESVRDTLNDVIRPMPGPKYLFQEKDYVMVMGKNEDLLFED